MLFLKWLGQVLLPNRRSHLLTKMCNCARSLEALRADAYELVPPGVRELVKLEVIDKTRWRCSLGPPLPQADDTAAILKDLPLCLSGSLQETYVPVEG